MENIEVVISKPEPKKRGRKPKAQKSAEPKAQPKKAEPKKEPEKVVLLADKKKKKK